MASSLSTRLFYLILSASGGQDSLLFADDILMVAGREAEIVYLGVMIFLWSSLGVPWKWRKWRGGHQVSWIGYWICFETYQVGISEARSKWLCRWIHDALEKGEAQMSDFRAVLGRISFALGVLDYLKPFILPLFSWTAACPFLGLFPSS